MNEGGVTVINGSLVWASCRQATSREVRDWRSSGVRRLSWALRFSFCGSDTLILLSGELSGVL